MGHAKALSHRCSPNKHGWPTSISSKTKVSEKNIVPMSLKTGRLAERRGFSFGFQAILERYFQ
jgi:hypothetical protein